MEDNLEPGENRQINTTPMVGEDREHVVSLAKYMLTTDIPEDVREEFTYLFLLFDKDYALANLERIDLPYFNSSYEFVTLAMSSGLIDYAREVMVQVIQDLKLTRSVDALQLKLGISGVQRSESITKIEQEKIRRSMGSRIAGAFRRSKGGETE